MQWRENKKLEEEEEDDDEVKRIEDPVRCVHIAFLLYLLPPPCHFGTVRCQVCTYIGLHRIEWTCSHTLNMIRERRTMYIRSLNCPNSLSLGTWHIFTWNSVWSQSATNLLSKSVPFCNCGCFDETVRTECNFRFCIHSSFVSLLARNCIQPAGYACCCNLTEPIRKLSAVALVSLFVR